MMRYLTCFLWLLAAMVLPVAATAADEEKTPFPVSGSLGLSGMYDSNFSLNEARANDDLHREDFILGVDAKIDTNLSWARLWQLEFDLQGLGNWPYYHSEDPWYVGNANLYLGLNFGANTVSVLDSARYFSTPDDFWSDFVRNAATLAYKRTLFRLLEGRLGYENILSSHPDNHPLDYFMNGGFVELRNTWTPLVSTYYSVDYLAYVGGEGDADSFKPRAPEKGDRFTVEAGVDAFFAQRHCLRGAYLYQVDDSDYEPFDMASDSSRSPTPTPTPIQTDPRQHDGPSPPMPPGSSPPPMSSPSPGNMSGDFGRSSGDQGSLDIDAEFGFIKHKAEVFYSVRLNDRFTLSLYDEYVYKTFSRATNPIPGQPDRIDRLFLTSAWLTVRLEYGLYTKARYLYRMNDPLSSTNKFEDHIGSLSLEYHF